jgi:hypothetical protein
MNQQKIELVQKVKELSDSEIQNLCKKVYEHHKNFKHSKIPLSLWITTAVKNDSITIACPNWQYHEANPKKTSVDSYFQSFCKDETCGANLFVVCNNEQCNQCFTVWAVGTSKQYNHECQMGDDSSRKRRRKMQFDDISPVKRQRYEETEKLNKMEMIIHQYVGQVEALMKSFIETGTASHSSLCELQEMLQVQAKVLDNVSNYSELETKRNILLTMIHRSMNLIHTVKNEVTPKTQ